MTRRVLAIVVVLGCQSSSSSHGAADAAIDALGDGSARLCVIGINGSAGPDCGAGTFCEEFTAGIAPRTGTCMTLPAACTATPTCTCLMMNVSCGATDCSGSGDDLGLVCMGI